MFLENVSTTNRHFQSYILINQDIFINLINSIYYISEKMENKTDMEYRYLGPTGIRVSVISYGNWVNSNDEKAKQNTIDCVKKAWDLGVNFFDTAEVYGFGEAEVQIGEALRLLKVPRHHLVVSTKIFWGHKQNIPNLRGLSRKHVIEGTKSCLKRLGLDYVDLLFCHRPDYSTPMQETCRAFDWLIRKGFVFYWGTSQWEAADIAEAHMICEKYNLVKPVVQQCEYNLFNRKKMQIDYRHLFESKKLGTTVWSPLASGILTGKYNDGAVVEDSRFKNNPDLLRIFNRFFTGEKRQQTLKALNTFKEISEELKCTMAQLAMAWVINNPDISTAITGASSPKQLEDTFQAVTLRKKLTPEIEKRIEQAFKTAPKGKMNVFKRQMRTSRRFQTLGYNLEA